MWGSPLGYTASAAALWQEGGAMAFFRGIAPTLWREEDGCVLVDVQYVARGFYFFRGLSSKAT
jgi:hypothetical protein